MRPQDVVLGALLLLMVVMLTVEIVRVVRRARRVDVDPAFHRRFADSIRARRTMIAGEDLSADKAVHLGPDGRVRR